MKNNSRVLVVGGGPTGLTVASELLRQGISCRIIDKRDAQSSMTRAINISSASLKIFQKMGLAEKMIEQGMCSSEITIYWNKKRLININYNYLRHLPFPFFLYLPQPKTEAILNNHLLSLGGKVERKISLIEIHQNNSHIEVKIRDASDNIHHEIFDYVIGCDGGKSLVREQAGIPCHEEDYGAHFILADASIEWEGDKKKPHYFVSDQGYLMVVPLPNGLHRLIASRKNQFIGQYTKNPTLEDFKKVINERAPSTIKIKELVWVTSAPFRHQIATQAQRNRIFLVGDALHLFSPVGGMNMNMGIQDAYNLARKLGNHIKGLAKPEMLKSYSIERLEAAAIVQKMTRKATDLIAQNIHHNVEESKKFLPTFKNREFIKKLLPIQFSGFIKEELL